MTNTHASVNFDALFVKYGDKYSVPPTWLKAIAMNESSLGTAKSVAIGMANPKDIENSKSSDGKSWGLMQVTLATAKKLDPAATEEKLNSPEYSVDLAAKLCANNMRAFSKFDDRYIEWVIKSYNQGVNHTLNERAGKPSNPSWQAHVQEYWARWQRNLEKAKESML